MSEAEHLAQRLAEARRLSSFGLPETARGRIGLLRRFLARVLRPMLDAQSAYNRAVVDVVEATRAWEGRLDRIDSDLAHHSSVLVRHEEVLARHEEMLRELVDQLAQLGERVERDHAHHHAVLLRHEEPLSRHEDTLHDLATSFAAVSDEFAVIREQYALVSDRIELAQRQAFARFHEGVASIRAELSELDATARTGFDGVDARFSSVEHDADRAFAELRLRLGEVDVFLDLVRRSMPEIPAPEKLATAPSAFDTLYPAFEESFRGSEDAIAERMRHYLPDVAHLPGPLLDVGFGRGEWLQILKEEGIEAYGVEIHAAYVERALARGIDARLGDVRDHLLSLPPASLGAMTAHHVVEHLSIDVLIETLDLALRALRPGGVLILETPNPENLAVGAMNFYFDPTHHRPLPPDLLSFLVTSRGFAHTRVDRLSRGFSALPAAQGTRGADVLADVWEFLRTHIFGPEDYAVIATRL